MTLALVRIFFSYKGRVTSPRKSERSVWRISTVMYTLHFRVAELMKGMKEACILVCFSHKI
jgi:hypothetical protein